jgi:predicted kinase
VDADSGAPVKSCNAVAEPQGRIHLVPKTLVLLMGVAGTGKTTLAKALLRRICAVYLDNNFIADAFFPNTRSDDAYMQLRDKFYSVLFGITQENLKVGNTVLVDAPHVKEMRDDAWRNGLAQFVSTNDAALRVIRCFTTEDILRRRIQTRGERRDDWKLRNWQGFLREQPLFDPVPFDHLDLDTGTEDIDGQTARAVNYLLSHKQV